MTAFIITALIGVILALVGLSGVQRTGNYENVWGVLCIWGVPVAVILGIILAIVI